MGGKQNSIIAFAFNLTVAVVIAAMMVSLVPLSAFAEAGSNSAEPGSENAAAGDGSRIVGKLTLSVYPGSRVRWMPHSTLTYTTYEDIDLDISFYMYFKPNQKYMSLMKDYANDPDKYNSDPVLYNKDDLVIDDRESYFDATFNDKYSEPETISLKEGESINIATSAYDEINIQTVLNILEDSTIAPNWATSELIKQLHYYLDGDSRYDRQQVFIGVISTLVTAYKIAIKTGHNPIDGRQIFGGLFVNRELHDQFVSEVSRLPNNYYTVEITADELENMKEYISDPANNYFSFLDRNCTYGASHIWNLTLSDRPELHVKANYTRFCADPESLYIELECLRKKKGIDGYGGRNFIPRTPEYWTEEPEQDKADNTLKIKARTASVKYSRLKKKSQTLKASKVINFIDKGQGAISYRKLDGSKKITVSKTTGKVTVGKGLKKGTYKVKVQVRAAGNSRYKESSWKKTTFRIKVK